MTDDYYIKTAPSKSCHVLSEKFKINQMVSRSISLFVHYRGTKLTSYVF